MKKLNIKGSVPFFTPARLIAVYALSLIICVPLRIFHVFSLIEPQTGFYSETNFSVVIFYVVLAFSCLFCLVGAYLSKNNITFTDKSVNANVPVGIIAILLSIGFFLDFGYCFVLSVDGENAYSYTAADSFAALMRSGFIPRKAEMLFAALSFIYFLVFAILVISKKYKGQMKIFSLVTVFWGITRLITLFVRQISFVRVSDLFLEIAATAFMTLFFFSFCECVSGVYRKEAQWRILGVGLPASLCCLVIQIPRIAAGISDNIHAGEPGYTVLLYNDDYILNYVEIFTGIIIISFFIALIKNKKSENNN